MCRVLTSLLESLYQMKRNLLCCRVRLSQHWWLEGVWSVVFKGRSSGTATFFINSVSSKSDQCPKVSNLPKSKQSEYTAVQVHYCPFTTTPIVHWMASVSWAWLQKLVSSGWVSTPRDRCMLGYFCFIYIPYPGSMWIMSCSLILETVQPGLVVQNIEWQMRGTIHASAWSTIFFRQYLVVISMPKS